MSSENTTKNNVNNAKSGWKLVWKRFSKHKPAMISSIVLLLILITCFSAPFIAPHNPAKVRADLIFADPDPSQQFYLGNDYLGRDILSRLIYGGRISLIVGFVVAFINAVIGSILGAIAGYFSGQPMTLVNGLWRNDNRETKNNSTVQDPININNNLKDINLFNIAMSTLLVFTMWGLNTFLHWNLWYWLALVIIFVASSVLRFTILADFTKQIEKNNHWIWSLQTILLGIILMSMVSFTIAYTEGVAVLTARVTWAIFAAVVLWLLYGALFHRIRIDLDVLISRIIDFALSIPLFPILLVLAGLLNDPRVALSKVVKNIFGESSSIMLIIIVLSVLGWITNARLIRGEILKLREQDFTDAARALGVSNTSIMFKHLLPNAIAPLIVSLTFDIGLYIIIEAGLSFLGFGVQEPAASWGNMLNGVQNYVLQAPWLAIWPGLAIVITVLSFNYIGDGLRDALDPRSQIN